MKLTPQELLFQSFRHSQGNGGSQLRIFRYMELAHDVIPDLHPTASDLDRFIRYARGTGHAKKSHVDLTVKPDKVTGMVIGSIKALRSTARTKYGENIRRQGLDSTVHKLAASIVNIEMGILGSDQPWTSYDNGQPYDRPERLKARVENGQGSYLYYYGRDGHTTGRQEFDDMYADVWAEVEKPEFAERRAWHAAAVVDAEQGILGRTEQGRVDDIQHV